MNYTEYKVRVYENGLVEWRNTKGQYHRTDGPAVVRADGSRRWYQNGKRHRTDGPAVVYADGAQLWYQNGRCHRTDGPAIVCADGTQRWYLKGVNYTKAEYQAKVNPSTCHHGKMVEIDGRKYKLEEVK